MNAYLKTTRQSINVFSLLFVYSFQSYKMIVLQYREDKAEGN